MVPQPLTHHPTARPYSVTHRGGLRLMRECRAQQWGSLWGNVQWSFGGWAAHPGLLVLGEVCVGTHCPGSQVLEEAGMAFP